MTLHVIYNNSLVALFWNQTIKCFLSLGCLIATLVLSAAPPARADCNPCAHDCHDKVVPAASIPEFSDVQVELQELVNLYGFYPVNKIYVIAYPASPNDEGPGAFVYWPTQKKFVAWGIGGFGPRLVESELIDLETDIEPDNSGMSGYYWTVTSIKQQICDTIHRGQLFIIKKTEGGWTPISQHPEFSTVKTQLQFVIDHDIGERPLSSTEKKRRRNNHFCVIGQQDGKFLAAYVWWKEQHRLYAWLPDATTTGGVSDIYLAAYQVDLNAGLYDQEERYSGDYIEEIKRSYARNILQACNEFGENFIINPSS